MTQDEPDRKSVDEPDGTEETLQSDVSAGENYRLGKIISEVEASLKNRLLEIQYEREQKATKRQWIAFGILGAITIAFAGGALSVAYNSQDAIEVNGSKSSAINKRLEKIESVIKELDAKSTSIHQKKSDELKSLRKITKELELQIIKLREDSKK